MKTKTKPIALSVFVAGLLCSKALYARSDEFSFDSKLVGGSDVSRFNDGQQLPGEYLVSVYLNDAKKSIGEFKVDFEYREDALTPILKRRDMPLFNIDPSKLSIFDYGYKDSIDFERSNIKYNFSFYGMRLRLYVPKNAIINNPTELAPESQWDEGINALLLNYDAKAYHRDTRYKTYNNDYYYLYLKPGVNIGSWRLRNSGIWQRDYKGVNSYQNSYTFAERDIRQLKSKILIGEGNTSSDVFSSIPFTGGQFATSDEMIPFYERTYVPLIRGIANSVAKVEVRQNGYLIYSTEVPAGPYTLTDVPAAEGEDLEVTVTDSSGTVQHFNVPYNIPAISLKDGRAKYEFTVGKYRPYSSVAKDDEFGQISLIYGINSILTGYTGFQISNNYRASAFGLGFNLYNFGALSLDGIYSINETTDRQEGSVFRVRYNKLLTKTHTSFNVSSYQYASEEFSSFSDAMESDRGGSNGYKKKNDTSLSIRQDLFDYGSLDLSLSRTSFFNKKQQMYASVYYNTSLFNTMGFSLGWNRVLNSYSNNEEDVFSATISVPLGRFTQATPTTNVRYQVVNESDNSISNLISLNGTAYENRLSWNINQSTNSKNHYNKTTSVVGSFRDSFGTLSGMYNYNPSITQYGGGISGSVVLHSQGITFGQPINGSAALIYTPDTYGIQVSNRPWVVTDKKGFAIVTPLNNYRKNEVRIQQANLQSNTDVKKTVNYVVPTSNAIVLASYKTIKGKKALFSIKSRDNKNIPFGAMVYVDGNEQAGIIGDDGKVFLSGLKEKGILNVRWEGKQNQECLIPYRLNFKNSVGVYISTLKCQ
ncbi:fimbrial biogenesis outer membrane usher protein [Escherichia coli]|nr:fimbrial biogenesis outer membrane usher protein [Escherichia coli]